MNQLLNDDWKHYLYVGHTETWKAVLLSLDINPKFAELERDHYAVFRENNIKSILLDRRKYTGSVTQSQIRDRYEIVEKRKFEGKYAVGNSEVHLERFVEFAKQINLSPFPKKFIKLFQKNDNLITTEAETTKQTKQPQKIEWSINYPKRDKLSYSRPLTQALEHFLSIGSSPPTPIMVAKYWLEVKPDGISVDLLKNEFTFPQQEKDKTSSFKNLSDTIRKRIVKSKK
jgi:hypothetical protein